MKVSLSWLNDYIPIDKASYSSIADSLTMVGLEVDSVTDRYDYLDSVVVGRILNIKAHPNAEKLKVCDVDIGSRVIRVVCGAPNIHEDMVAPVALPGTRFPEGSVLEKRKNPKRVVRRNALQRSRTWSWLRPQWRHDS